MRKKKGLLSGAILSFAAVIVLSALLRLPLVYSATIDGMTCITQIFSSAGNGYITLSGKDTTASTAMQVGDYGYYTFFWKLTQASDSVMVDSIIITGSADGVTYSRTVDRNGSTAWAKITGPDSTATTMRSISVAMPLQKWIKLTAYNSKAKGGTGQKVYATINMAP